ncbi:MAG: hypothetical protein LBJ08_03420, partial [Bifidobacteriaceae bacterium]|jgi:hypothetical protein|nr:hypothetical protein [Bifidobacteriaceae bacterium]
VWAGGLLGRGGRLLALKGRRAEEELTRARRELHRCGFGEARVVAVTALPGVETTFVVEAGFVGRGRGAGAEGRFEGGGKVGTEEGRGEEA